MLVLHVLDETHPGCSCSSSSSSAASYPRCSRGRQPPGVENDFLRLLLLLPLPLILQLDHFFSAEVFNLVWPRLIVVPTYTPQPLSVVAG